MPQIPDHSMIAFASNAAACAAGVQDFIVAGGDALAMLVQAYARME